MVRLCDSGCPESDIARTECIAWSSNNPRNKAMIMSVSITFQNCGYTPLLLTSLYIITLVLVIDSFGKRTWEMLLNRVSMNCMSFQSRKLQHHPVTGFQVWKLGQVQKRIRDCDFFFFNWVATINFQLVHPWFLLLYRLC